MNTRQQTDKKLAEMEKHLAGIYERASKEVGEKWKAYMGKAAEAVKPYEQALATAKKSGDADAIKKAEAALAQEQKSVTILDKHYRNMTTQLAAELSNVNKTAAAYINDQLPEIYAINYNGLGGEIEGVATGYSFELVDRDAVKNLATKDETLLPYKYIDGRKDIRWNTQAVNSEVLQGIIQGESIPNIAKRLRNVTDMNRASAIRNARTATTGAENRGRMDMLRGAREKGVNAKKVWLATGDNRTRDAHAELDGQDVDIDEPFVNEFGEIMFPGDPAADPANVYNCRCTLTYKVMGFGPAKETRTEFTPATSIEEAEQYISQFVDTSLFGATGVDYAGVGLDAANEVNRTLSTLMRTFDVPKIGGVIAPAGNTKLGKLMANATAAYSPVQKSFFLNRKTFKSVATAQKAFKAEGTAITDILTHPEKYDLSRASARVAAVVENSRVSGRGTVPVTIEQALQHEFGHSLEKQVLKHELWATAKANMETYAPQISGYACQDASEYIAESFCSYMQGEQKADPVLVNIFESFKR